MARASRSGQGPSAALLHDVEVREMETGTSIDFDEGMSAVVIGDDGERGDGAHPRFS